MVVVAVGVRRWARTRGRAVDVHARPPHPEPLAVAGCRAACQVMRELYGLDVQPSEFLPFTGMGEAHFLGGVANKHGAPFSVDAAKAKFFEIYMRDYALPGEAQGLAQTATACSSATSLPHAASRACPPCRRGHRPRWRPAAGGGLPRGGAAYGCGVERRPRQGVTWRWVGWARGGGSATRLVACARCARNATLPPRVTRWMPTWRQRTSQ